MLAALLLNLERPGPILREQTGTLTLRDVERAGKDIERLLAKVFIPEPVKAKVKRAVRQAVEYQELPEVSPSRLIMAQEQAESAIESLQSFMDDMQAPQWQVELRVILERLTLIAWQLNDDEEALLLLM